MISLKKGVLPRFSKPGPVKDKIRSFSLIKTRDLFS